jgi:hypothetical protein
MATGIRILFFLLLIAAQVLPGTGFSQEVRVNQKKIERDRAKKKKLDMKYYEQAVRRHNKMQSKSTKSSMKKTKKASKKSTPSMR